MLSPSERQKALTPILNKFDCFGWVPTIRGALSLDLAGESAVLLGDVDRHSAVVHHHNGLRSEHFIAATSLTTVNDSKCGPDYARTFRYVFVGAIHNQNQDSEFVTRHKFPAETAEMLDKEGIFTGRLLIIVKTQYALEPNEVSVIREIRNLAEKCHEYQDKYSINAASMAELHATRLDMVNLWKSIRENVDKLADQSNQSIYSFEVALTRDGLMMLRNTSSEKNSRTFSVPGTPSDYTQNIAIHRVFKFAMNFVKYLFHNNYHHNSQHDTYLPASNLHPCHGSNDLRDFHPIFKHQLDSFINPVMKLKRSDFKKYNIDPNGVMLYAKAFVTTCDANGLVDDRVVKDTNTYLGILTDEINHMTRHHKSRISSLVAQRSWIFIISAVLALTVAIIKIASVIIAYPQKPFHELDITSAKAAIMVLAVMMICWGGYEIAHAQILKHEFRRSPGKSLASRILQKLKVDSNLFDAKLSKRYLLYIKLMDRYLTFGPKRYQWLAGFLQFAGAAALIYGIWRLLSSIL